MYYPEEVSNFKVKLVYKGRSCGRFKFNREYRGVYVYGVERGYKASSLDYILLSNGYRLLPYEEKKYFKWVNGVNSILMIMYGRVAKYNLRDLVYSKNPFLALIEPRN